MEDILDIIGGFLLEEFSGCDLDRDRYKGPSAGHNFALSDEDDNYYLVRFTSNFLHQYNQYSITQAVVDYGVVRAMRENVNTFVGSVANRVFMAISILADSIKIGYFENRKSNFSLFATEPEQTLNQLLVELDGFEGNEGVIVIAATNRPDVLDKALLRPGRFDRQVYVGLPDILGREQILKVHMRKVPQDENVSASVIARGTPGFSGADLANIVNEAALFAARANKRVVTMEDFEMARDKIMMGAERKSMVMSEKEKENTAYHEAGHAIVGRLVPEHDPVHKVTIIPRGRALGVTQFLPEGDKYSLSKRAIESQLCSLFGGRIAEEITLGVEGVTTGAQNDIERATELARNMVTKWGLSEKLGPLHYGEDEGIMPGTGSPNYSGATSKTIDEEVRRIVDVCYKKSQKILEENRDILEAMKDALMEFETIDAEQVDDLMARKKVRPPHDWHEGDFNGHLKSDAAEPKGSDKKAGPIGGPTKDP